MGVHAVSCVSELHPALYVPVFWSHYMLAHAISLIGVIVGSKGKKRFWRPLHKIKAFLNSLTIQNLASIQL